MATRRSKAGTCVQVRYALLGQAPLQFTVHTIGGMLEPGGLAMVAPEQPTLADGEEVLLFLRRSGDEYVIAGDNGGKSLVYNGYATNPAFHLEMAQADLVFNPSRPAGRCRTRRLAGDRGGHPT